MLPEAGLIQHYINSYLSEATPAGWKTWEIVADLPGRIYQAFSSLRLVPLLHVNLSEVGDLEEIKSATRKPLNKTRQKCHTDQS